MKPITSPTLDDLKPAPYNPRSITAQASAGLAASIERFGDISGIVWNQRTGHLVAGHQRVEQLRKLGAQMVDGGLEVMHQGERHRFPVRVVDWSELDEKMANVEANNPAIAGTYVEDVSVLLGEILAGVGPAVFDELALAGLIDGLDVSPLGELPALPDGDKAPFQQMTFTLHDDQARMVVTALEAAKMSGAFTGTWNENSNGNAIARVCETYLTVVGVGRG